MIRPVPPDLDAFEKPAFDAAAALRCPPPETLLPALERTLPAPLQDRVASHLLTCSICRGLADALAAGDCAELTQEEARRVRRRSAAGFRRKRYPLAAATAAVIAVVATGLWIRQFDRSRSEPPPAPKSPEVSRARAARSFVLALNVPEIELPPAALTLRSEAADPYITALAPALELFRRGNYSHAAEHLDAVIENYPKDPYALYYLGVARLLDERPLDALEPLYRSRALLASDSSLYPNASWYLAVALERSNRADQAVVILTQMCGRGDARGEQACGALGTLLAPRVGWNDRGATAPSHSLSGGDPVVQHALRAAGGSGV